MLKMYKNTLERHKCVLLLLYVAFFEALTYRHVLCVCLKELANMVKVIADVYNLEDANIKHLNIEGMYSLVRVLTFDC